RGPRDVPALARRCRGRAPPAGGRRREGEGESSRQGPDSRESRRAPVWRRRPRECRRLHRAGHARRGHRRVARRRARRLRGGARVRRSERSGILAVEKGPGVTSFQVVAHLRRLLRAAKIGHGGTLDPEATGVLPILIGEATKLTPYLTELDKEYLARVRLGVTTTTQDMTGEVTETRPVPSLD